MVPDRDDDGAAISSGLTRQQPVHSLGEIISIRATEPTETFEALRENDARFRALLSSLDDLVLELDEHGTYLSVWTTEEPLLVAPVEELLGSTLSDQLGRRIGGRFVRALRRALDSGQPQVVEYRLEVPAGIRWFQARLAPIKDGTGRPLTVCALVRDVSERKAAEKERDEAERQLRYQAMHDGVTDLANRSLFFERLAQNLERAKDRGEPLTVLMLDLDNFKLVNDTFGHAVGDEILQHVARRLETATRAGDSIARLGGDEFAVLIADAANEKAEAVIERLSRSLEGKIAAGGDLVTIKVSIGAASYPKDGQDADSLLTAADVAMYRAKRRAHKQLERERTTESEAVAAAAQPDHVNGLDRPPNRAAEQPLSES